jgi:hypothetical protein
MVVILYLRLCQIILVCHLLRARLTIKLQVVRLSVLCMHRTAESKHGEVNVFALRCRGRIGSSEIRVPARHLVTARSTLSQLLWNDGTQTYGPKSIEVTMI